ncbi:MAG: ATP-binding protein [Verrucomicrobiia bacterium]
MKNRLQLRLIGLVVAVVLTWASIAFLVVELQWQSGALSKQLKEVDSESYRIGDEFRDHLRQLNESLYHYGRSHTLPDVAAFNKASHELDLWIDEQKPKLATAQEKAIMNQIDTAYDDYLRAAKELLVRLVALGDVSATMDEYTGVRTESQRLYRLGQELTQAHLASRDQVMARVEVLHTELRALVLVALGLLCLFSLALAFVAYRDLIEPLRVKLVESQTLLEHQEKLASLGTLAAGVAHEIRNPLTAIKAALFIQKKKFSNYSPERDDVEVMEREISRLERIVNNFLQFARPAEPELTTISADLLLLESQHFFAPQLERNNIRLNLEPSEPMRIRVDTGQFKQVLINLIQNAADSIGRDGTVTLRARPGRKRLANGETPVVIFEVTDTGKGIPPHLERRLFDPFFTTKENGAGLGLSIAARIVQQHGGRLQYQTQVDRGTTFGIILPRVIE